MTSEELSRETYQRLGDERNDWRWQMRNRISTVSHLRKWIRLDANETEAIERCRGLYRWTVTPYYADLMDPDSPACPIRRQAVPGLVEFQDLPDSEADPVGDRDFRRTNRVIHKYPDRAILLVTQLCPVYCRHCTRKYHTSAYGSSYFETGEAENFTEDFDYIRSHSEIRDVLLTGGDPLTYGDERLRAILRELRAIEHVEIIRVGTRYPVLLPQRITLDFCRMLEAFHPVWLNTHFNHPKEVTAEAAAACDRLLRHGVPVQNQTVLLRDINDDDATFKDLLRQLLRIRVRPYYLYHCDNVRGVSGFATTIERGRELMDAVSGYMTGFAVPTYVLTTKLGKIPLHAHQFEMHEDRVWIQNYAGEHAVLPNVWKT